MYVYLNVDSNDFEDYINIQRENFLSINFLEYQKVKALINLGYEV